MSLMTLDCPGCHDERQFEPPHDQAGCPDRADSPPGGCPELACVDCGTALMVGFATPRSTLSVVGPHGAEADRPHRSKQSPERAA